MKIEFKVEKGYSTKEYTYVTVKYSKSSIQIKDESFINPEDLRNFIESLENGIAILKARQEELHLENQTSTAA